MKLEEYFNALAPDDIRLKGTRIGIESILYEYIYRSKTPEEIAEQFHTVTLEQVYATILYYLHNRSEVDAYLVNWLKFSRTIREEQQRNPSPARMRFRQMQEENAGKQLQES
ncbi:DUF433 domain-containing protein [Nostoc punctiforme]|uniref:DUF433 domain-containing protein n=1 Tax=Nostoc punctiforme (strain ATCC 29133 / PCC 73102) TaxID=63737 RepID=B2J922_NOSP7|nr:DUF433 domain-containing protein [Nostoc punctiforme]ACC84038.1 hypothetical protein Npun_F5738 [Nostoc punctiforme PCC 73102]